MAHSKAHFEQPPNLELRILTSRIGLCPQPPGIITSDELAQSAMTTSSPNPLPPSDFTCLLSGPLDDFLLYSGREHSQWLIDIAHDVCDPALKHGSLQVWDADKETWRNVNWTDPLIASAYLYDVQDTVSLSKISHREGRTKTSVIGNPSTMAKRVEQRDGGRCWVTRSAAMHMNSRVCPKRMGDHLLHIVYDTFVSPHPLGLSVYDEMCGITLDRTLDGFFGKYELGLRLVGPNQYECHVFSLQDVRRHRIVIYGPTPDDDCMVLLHGHRTSPPQPQHTRNPPPGLIRWHYLQCVIRKFAHPDYRKVENIYYSELPLRMEGDSDDEGTDSELEWPTAALDRGRAMQMEIKRQEERKGSVSDWIAAM